LQSGAKELGKKEEDRKGEKEILKKGIKSLVIRN
jgi:hypothetical protein